MAIIAGTATTFAGAPGLQGLREDLSNEIYMISPETTPFMSNVGRGTADAVLHEWQVDSLAPPNLANAQFQGDDISSFTPASVTTRLGNRTQISRKEVIVSGTVEAVNKAGRKSEIARQMYKRGRELKIDIESIILSNQAAAVGAVATAPKAASVLAWIKTNVSHVGTNPVGDGSNARTDGTPRPFTETMLKTTMASVYTNSGEDLDVLMVPPAQKAVVSGFAGGAQKQVDVTKATVVSTVDIYVGDFFTVNVVPNRWMRSRDALLLNYDYWSVDWLRPIKREPLAKTGDAHKELLQGEWTLVAKNEAANGLIADLS